MFKLYLYDTEYDVERNKRLPNFKIIIGGILHVWLYLVYFYYILSNLLFGGCVQASLQPK